MLLFVVVWWIAGGKAEVRGPAAACKLSLAPFYEDYQYFHDGDVIVGGVLTVNSFVAHYSLQPRIVRSAMCMRPNVNNYYNILKFIYAVEKSEDALRIIAPNITLGYHLYDSCLDGRKAIRSVLQILSGPKKTVPNYSCSTGKVAGFIGDHFSVTTLPVAELLGVYGYAQISYGATDYKLSDRRVYPHFFRMLHNDHVHYKVISKLLKRFGWTWVGIIVSDDAGGETESQWLMRYLSSYDICVAFTIKIGINKYNVKNAEMERNLLFVQRSSAEVIILCGAFNLAIADFLSRSHRAFNDKTLILPPSWASNSYLTGNFIPAFNGSLAIELCPMYFVDDGVFFKKVSPSKRPTDKLLEYIWITLLKCLTNDAATNYLYSHIYKLTLRNCTGEDYFLNTKEQMYIGVSPRVFFALHHYIKRVSNLVRNDSALFFDENGDFGYCYTIVNWRRPDGRLSYPITVGNFTPWASEDQQITISSTNIVWKNNKIPISRCSEKCLPGYRKALKPGIQTCCYDCVRCSEGEISNRSDSEFCIKCPDNECPDERKTQCVSKMVEFLSYENDPISAIILFVTTVFCFITAVILIIFTKFRHTAIVKLNNKNLSFLLLVSIKLSFLCVFLFLGRPVDITCMLRQTAFGVIYSLAVSSLLAKTLMVCNAFKATKPGSFWVGTKVSNFVVLICSSAQVLINIIWLTTSPPFQELDMHSYPGKIIIQFLSFVSPCLPLPTPATVVLSLSSKYLGSNQCAVGEKRRSVH
ncbi:vomeronasal type-2 receptor 26-like [Spea bombifrons]|uniref:vomeronasal type-2 receptor 26-like n=1 Tax=Spea bombifrons TaxID=233779 RepID=UPI0023498046|nr:vomeronasal type-2 receptor 26-like [Spea bombifrons]